MLAVKLFLYQAVNTIIPSDWSLDTGLWRLTPFGASVKWLSVLETRW